MDIAPGTTVCVEITAPPTAAAARKTLTRVACKDPAVARQIRARKQQRPSLETWQRGGRMWRHRMKSRPPVSLNAGAKYTLRATLDVIRDLESVGSWVKVSPV
jgi:hypothetical protein